MNPETQKTRAHMQICMPQIHCVVIIKPIDSRATGNRFWRALTFVPFLTSPPLTKIVIIYTQLLQEEKVFPMLPISGWSAQWSPKMLKDLSEKLREKFPATPCGYFIWQKLPSPWCFLRGFWTRINPVERQSLQQKDKKRRQRKGQKTKSLKTYVTFSFKNSNLKIVIFWACCQFGPYLAWKSPTVKNCVLAKSSGSHLVKGRNP